MNRAFDDLVARLTDRLKVDPELQLETAHELRTHLEDSAAEFKAAGESDEASQESAIKVLGNETELADKLWEANRRRIRVRKAVKWAAGITLAPVAGVVTIAITWNAIISILLLASVLPLLRLGGVPMSGIYGHIWQSITNSLPSESRFILDTNQPTPHAAADHATALMNRYPSDPVYCANDVLQLVRALETMQPKPTATYALRHAELWNQMLAAIDRGERLEPDNAFYPLIESDLCLSASATESSTSEASAAPLLLKFTVPWSKTPDEVRAGQYQVTDHELFARGLAQLRLAAGKPRLESHVAELVERRLTLLPQPISLTDLLMRKTFEMEVFLPNLNLYRIGANRACWQAQDAALRGDIKTARQIAADAQTISLLVSQDCHVIVEHLVAQGMYGYALETQAIVDKVSGMPAKSQADLAQMIELESAQIAAQHHGAWRQQEVIAHGSSLDTAWLASQIDSTKINFSPGINAEYAALDRAALALFLIALIVIAVMPGIPAVLGRLQGFGWPTFIFIGWKRLGVTLVAAIAPVGIYALLAYFTPLGNRGYGMTFSLERIAVEYATVATAVLICLRVSSAHGLGARLTELGIVAPKSAPISRITILLGALLGSGIVAYLIVWHKTVDDPLIRGWGFCLAVLVALYGLQWISAASGRARALRQTVMSMLGIVVGIAFMVAAILVVGSPFVGHPNNLPVLLSSGLAALGLLVLLASGYGLLKRGLRGWKEAWKIHNPLLGYGLSLAPSFLLAAIVLVVVAAWPLRAQEAKDVHLALSPGGGPELFHELEQSRLWGIHLSMGKLLIQHERGHLDGDDRTAS